jgi:hypothetical protein
MMEQDAAPSLFEQGKADSPHRLRDRLATAPPPYAEGALINPGLDESLLGVLLRNRDLTESILIRIGNDERLMRSDDVKGAVARHRATPRAISMHLVKFLQWRDVADMCRDQEVPAALRTLAEQVLAGRLSQIPPVEKLKLARTGGRGVLAALFRSRDPRLVPELLRNPRVAERDVSMLTRDKTTPSTLLGAIARDEKWSNRPSIRLSLVENRSTPLSDTLRLVKALPTLNLRTIRQNPRLPAPLRAEAAKQLAERQKGRRR